MDTFRKWLNKPKADDKSLLARFYHADRSLTAVTSELDSFDGRAEPDRCSRLVSRLRQGQDKVLAITNLIMEELLGEDRDPRAFRAKFPEEVLQENLAGQLWFGAECLAAGSSILNREQESKEMRPLAQAVTKSLGNVRNLLRDQCLRYNVPNSKTLHLNINDSSTEQLYESLKIFDRLFAEFELRYVSAMVPVKTKHEYEMQELISVLFSETLQRALKIGLLDQEKVDAFDPALMFSIPRLAIVSGLVIYPDGPLNMNMSSEELSEMFRPFRTILVKIRDYLNTLDKNSLFQLEKLLCTNEDINTKVPVGTSSIEAPYNEQQNTTTKANSNSINCDDSNIGSNNNNNNDNNRSNPTTNSTTEAQISVTSGLSKVLKRHSNYQHQRHHVKTRSPSISSVSANSSTPSTPTVSPIPSPTPSLASTDSSEAAISTTSAADFSDDDDDDDDVYGDNFESDDNDNIDENVEADNELALSGGDILLTSVNVDIVAADCASGYLIPNTNFGNLLQPQEVPLTGNFVASEEDSIDDQDEFEDAHNTEDVLPTSSSRLRRTQQPQQQTNKTNENNNNNSSSSSDNPSTSQIITENTLDSNSNSRSCRHHHHHHSHSHGHHHHHRPSRSSHHHHHLHNKLKRCHHQAGSSSSSATVTNECNDNKCDQKSPATSPTHHDTTSIDSRTSTSLSDGGNSPRDASLVALRANGRLKFKSTENLLHRLFVCIAGVADQLQTNFASDLRHILRSVFLMNMSITQEEELDIPEKTKESELFEFRASENDVIQESSNGSNQSIYSAEEVNPELDNVFNSSNGNNNNNHNNNNNSSRSSISSAVNSNVNQNNNSIRHSTGSTIQRVNTIDMGINETNTNSLRQHVERSRSLGDHEQHDNGINNNHSYNGSSSSSSSSNGSNSRRLSAYITGRRLSITSPQSSNNATTTSTTNSILRQHQQQQRQRNNSVGSNSPSSSTSSSSSSESNSPISERASSTRLEISNNQNLSSNTANTANNSNRAQINTVSSTTTTTCLAPPAWIPDDLAPRCMSCHTQFTAFRRRHHCRNCGGVFCSICSNASAPLPKYGLTKAVRVCRDCYVREVHGARTSQSQLATAHHQSANAATAGGS